MILARSDLAALIEHGEAEQAAVARPAELGVEQPPSREAMARKIVNDARTVALREYRR